MYLIKKQLSTWLKFGTVKSPYQILGLKQNATIQQIKKSYRNIAQKYHPDKNPDPSAQKIFMQAKQAYQILSDDDKRKQYDSQHQSSRNSHFDKNPFDQFNDDLYKDKSRTYHDTFTSGSNKKRKGDNIVKQITLQFIQAIKGTTLELNYQRKCTCPSCGGNKCKPGTAPTRCLSCGGSGSTVYRRGGIVMHLQCQRCKGIGLIIKYPCVECKATGILLQNVIQKVSIDGGVQSGSSISVNQKGDQSQNGPNGDLILKVQVKKHPKFRKIGNDIHSTEWISISQAALGTKKQIQTVWGTKNISISGGAQDGSNISIKGQGIVGAFRGDHIITLRIKVPTKLTQKQRRIFEQLAKEEDLNMTGNDSVQNETQSMFQKMKKAFK